MRLILNWQIAMSTTNFEVIYLTKDRANSIAAVAQHNLWRHREIIPATSKKAAIKNILGRDRTAVIISITQIKEKIQWFQDGASRDYKLRFLQSIHLNSSAGMSPTKALETVIAHDRSDNKYALSLALNALNNGGTFAHAVAQTGFFDKTTLAILSSGEMGGNTASSIQAAMDYYQYRDGALKLMLGIFAWLSIDIVFSVISVVGNKFAIPEIANSMGESADPAKKQLIMEKLGEVMFWNDILMYLTLAITIALVVILVGYRLGGSIQKWADNKMKHIAMLRNVFVHTSMAASSAVLAAMLKGGVTLQKALPVVVQSSTFPSVKGYWSKVDETIKKGGTVREALEDRELLLPHESLLILSHNNSVQLADIFGKEIATGRKFMGEVGAKKFARNMMIITIAYSILVAGLLMWGIYYQYDILMMDTNI